MLTLWKNHKIRAKNRFQKLTQCILYRPNAHKMLQKAQWRHSSDISTWINLQRKVLFKHYQLLLSVHDNRLILAQQSLCRKILQLHKDCPIWVPLSPISPANKHKRLPTRLLHPCSINLICLTILVVIYGGLHGNVQRRKYSQLWQFLRFSTPNCAQMRLCYVAFFRQWFAHFYSTTQIISHIS